LRNHQQLKKIKAVKYFRNHFIKLSKRETKKDAQDFNSNFVAKMHNDLKIDDENFTMRLQNFCFAFRRPVDLFKIWLSFISG
jgi:hypothetical protein